MGAVDAAPFALQWARMERQWQVVNVLCSIIER